MLYLVQEYIVEIVIYMVLEIQKILYTLVSCFKKESAHYKNFQRHGFKNINNITNLFYKPRTVSTFLYKHLDILYIHFFSFFILTASVLYIWHICTSILQNSANLPWRVCSSITVNLWPDLRRYVLTHPLTSTLK